MNFSIENVALAFRTWMEHDKLAQEDPTWELPDDFYSPEEERIDFNDPEMGPEMGRAGYFLALMRNIEEGKIK